MVVDGLTFVATMVGHLAWPAAAVIVALLFRKRIEALLARPAKRWKVGPVEAEWEEAAAEASVELAKSPEADSAPPRAAEPGPGSPAALLNVAPRAAVLEMGVRLEQMLRVYLEQAGIAVPPTSLLGLARAAEQGGLLSPELAQVVDQLRFLRNLAAHGNEPISKEQAREFVDLANAVINAIAVKQAEPTPQPAAS
jgi:hypothetical protein